MLSKSIVEELKTAHKGKYWKDQINLWERNKSALLPGHPETQMYHLGIYIR